MNRVGIHTYEVLDGLPLNPLGRTGIHGRGCLYFWGPNHAVQNIFMNSQSNEVIVAIDDENKKKASFPLVRKNKIFRLIFFC